MARATVVGFGNTLRGDDALGPVAAEQIAQRFGGSAVESVVRHTLTPELAATLTETEFVLFIDASRVGERCQLQESELVADPQAEVHLVHFLDPKALVTWTQAVYGRAPRAVLLSVLA